MWFLRNFLLFRVGVILIIETTILFNFGYFAGKFGMVHFNWFSHGHYFVCNDQFELRNDEIGKLGTSVVLLVHNLLTIVETSASVSAAFEKLTSNSQLLAETMT